jgi:hypothetical protein
MERAAACGWLVERIEQRAPPESHAWLAELVRSLRAHRSLELVEGAFAGAGRKLGRQALGDELELAVDGIEPIPLRAWSLDTAGRVAMILALGEGAPELVSRTLDGLYFGGDAREKNAIVRALVLLEGAERFASIALDAGRTNESELFAAVACDNPFPARHYPELEFNKLVMKAAFVKAPVDRIIGLVRRANPELARMGMEHIDEQESAGRSFVPELWLAIAPANPPGAVARMLGYLSHSVPHHRLGAARGLALAADPRAKSFLSERLELEHEEAIRTALQRAVAAVSESLA